VSRRPFTLLSLALACALGALAVWLAAFAVPVGQRLDGAAMAAFGAVVETRLQPSIQGAAGLAGLLPLLIVAAALVCVALLRGRWLMAATVPVILLAANLFTQLAKPSLAHPRIVELSGIQGTYPASWPSGHSTVAMSLALCAVLVAGPRLRPYAAVLGAAYAIAVGYSLVALGWHLPSDVLGGFLVAATFTLFGAAALAALEARRPERVLAARAHPLTPISVAALTAGAAALVVVVGAMAIVRAPGMALSALEHPVAIAAGVGIGALGLMLTAGLAAVLRH